ncbi:MAG: ParB/RepB/Spo0J family partition protein, partial [Ignavibacteriae bacterium]|nr:ParB/RepB/Spo0J family partition protein [Ignavibacteriota bacterium]
MNDKNRHALGRGLDALINPASKINRDEQVEIINSNLQGDDGSSQEILAKIDIENIAPNPFQPRTEFEPNALEELKKSILQNGLIQPVTVRRVTENKYELISGERRLRAIKEIGY